MAEAWYTPEELAEEAKTTQRQPEFDRETEVDPEDTSWDAMTALFARDAELKVIIAGITQDSESGIVTDDPVSL